MSFPEFTNPFVYAQFNMRGGWKNTLIVAAAYGLLVSGAIVATAQASNTPSTTMEGWVVGLLVIQALTLLMYGAARVSTVVRADVKAGLMESHRLMPTSPYSVVGGYIVGAPVQALFMAATTFIVGALVCPAAHVDIGRWLVANFMLLVFGLMTWTLTMLMALSTKGGVPVFLLSVVIGFCTSGVMMMLPAVSVLTSPLIARSIFTLRDSFADFSFVYINALVAQGLLTATCFLACVRRYRRPDEPSWNFSLGITLLTLVMGLSLVGMMYTDEFKLAFNRSELSTGLIASIVLCMATALVPISVVARQHARWRRESSIDAKPRPRVPTFIAVVLCTIVIAMLFWVGRQVTTPTTYTAQPYTPGHTWTGPTMVPGQALTDVPLRIEFSIVEILAALAGLAALFRWIYLAINKAWFVVSLWLVIFWVTPLIADTIHRSLQDRSSDPMGPIGSLSPIGTFIILWTGQPWTAIFGIAFAVGIPLLPIILMFATQRRQRRPQLAVATDHNGLPQAGV